MKSMVSKAQCSGSFFAVKVRSQNTESSCRSCSFVQRMLGRNIARTECRKMLRSVLTISRYFDDYSCWSDEDIAERPEIQKIDSRYVTQIWLFLLYRQSKTDISEVFWPVTVTVTSCINCIVMLYCQGVKDLEVVNRFVSGQVMKEVLRTTADALCSSKSDSVLFGSSLVRPWMCFLIANPSILCQGNLMHAVKRPVVLSPSENLLATLNKRLVCMMATHISHQTYCVRMVCWTW